MMKSSILAQRVLQLMTRRPRAGSSDTSGITKIFVGILKILITYIKNYHQFCPFIKFTLVKSLKK